MNLLSKLINEWIREFIENYEEISIDETYTAPYLPEFEQYPSLIYLKSSKFDNRLSINIGKDLFLAWIKISGGGSTGDTLTFNLLKMFVATPADPKFFEKIQRGIIEWETSDGQYNN